MEHKHLIVRAEINNPPMPSAGSSDASQIEHEIEDWLENLVDAIGMKILCSAKAKYCFDPENRGVTGFVILTTSHCTVHIWDNTPIKILQFDLYSCAPFDVNKVIDLLNIFEPTKIEYKFLDRENGLILISEK